MTNRSILFTGMITRILAALGRLRGKRTLTWTRTSSAELQAGPYSIIDEPNVPEVWVVMDRRVVSEHDSKRQAKAWCERHATEAAARARTAVSDAVAKAACEFLVWIDYDFPSGIRAQEKAARENLRRALAELDPSPAAAAQAALDRREAFEEAAKIADAYAAENFRMATDTVVLDRMQRFERTEEMQVAGGAHSAAGIAAENIAAAIRALATKEKA